MTRFGPVREHRHRRGPRRRGSLQRQAGGLLLGQRLQILVNGLARGNLSRLQIGGRRWIRLFQCDRVVESVTVHSVSRADTTEDGTALATAVTDPPVATDPPAVTDPPVTDPAVAGLSVDDNEEFLEPVPIRDDSLLLAAPAEVEPLVESPAEPSLTPPVAPSVEPLFEPSVEPLLEPSLGPNVEPVMEPSLELPVEPSPEAWTKPSGESLVEPSLEPSHEPPAEPLAAFIPLQSATTSVSVVPTDPVHPAGDAVSIPDDHGIPPRIISPSARPSAGVDMDAEMDAEMDPGIEAGMDSDVGNAEMGIDVGDSISARHSMPTWDVQPTPRMYPRIMSGSSVSEALRLTIRMRQEAGASGLEHTNTVLMENLSLIEPTKVSDTDKQQELIVYDVQSGRVNDSCLKPRSGQRGWLESKLEQSARHLNERVERMKVEYQELHDAWRRRHAEYASAPSLVPVNQSSANASIAPASNDVPATGRTTRRSAATLGDSVRSDLEMEQIIASLGYDEQMDANLISTRNLAEIPDMLSVSSSGLRYLYDDTNHLVTHPHEYYAVKTGITDWTDAEKSLFLDKYALYPKQFGLIATFMENKSARQCVDYYYLHKKSLIDFRRVVVRGGGKKRNGGRKGKSNGLMTDIQQHDAQIAAEERADVASSRSTTAAPSDRRKPPARRGTATPAVVATPEPEVKRRRGRPPGIGKTTEWTDEDRALFAQLLQEHGENFKRIAVRMPSKTTDAVSAYFKTQFSVRAKEQEDTSAIGPATPVTTAYNTAEPLS
ncbi:unnamed protein product [Mycena citricolor]|uniref:SANT domain-containing protein n=1 Tax=Mycena citricolor TaxID=2018698 RepID=A0AAD2Q4Z4_9AGAR|nr:unnamed protein product [Mycena citricolor]